MTLGAAKQFKRVFFTASAFLLVLTGNLQAQLNEHCTATILNRTIQVNADGSFALVNLPYDLGYFRVRVTCVEDGVTTRGQSGFFKLSPNSAVTIPPIVMGTFDPLPVSIEVTAPTTNFVTKGEEVPLKATATLPDTTTRDVTREIDGTLWSSSNPNIASINVTNGVVTVHRRGRVIFLARNEGVIGSFQMNILIPNDADHDGMTDEYETAQGFDPADASDAGQDLDNDGLTNLQEFLRGTNPRVADTDGDGLSDSAEISLGTDPTRADSDGDGLNDGQEVLRNTNPLVADTDGDGIPDGLELRLGLNPLVANAITTLQGRVVDNTGAPVEGASVLLFNLLTANTDSTGFFVITGVPATLGPLSAFVQVVRGGQILDGTSTAVAPVPGGTTLAGTIQVGLNAGTVGGLITTPLGDPAPGAQVTVTSGTDVRTVNADPNGRYRVANMTAGDLVVVVRDFRTGLRGRKTGVLAPTQSATVDVGILSLGTVTGTVLERDGVTPVGAGVAVTFGGSKNLNGTTDTLGQYLFDFVPLGVFSVDTSDGANRGRTTGNLTASAQVDVLDIAYLYRGTVTGIVRDGGNNPVPNATVNLYSQSLFGGSSEVNTDGSGRYSFGVFIGPFGLAARSPITRLAGNTGGFLERDNQILTLDIVLQASGSVVGTIYHAGGTTVVPDAEVILGGSRKTISDFQGRYRFELVPVGEFYDIDTTELATGDRGKGLTYVGMQDGVSTNDITLHGQGTVIVTVRDGADALVSGAEVSVASLTLFGGTTNKISDGNGLATFPRVLAGGFRVIAVNPATKLTGTTNGSVGLGGTTNITVRLQPSGSISGFVFLPDGISPAPNISVRLSNRQTTTANDGSFRFDIVPTGTHGLDARDAFGNLRARTNGIVLNTQGQTVTRNLIMIGVGIAEGVVTNANATPASGVPVTLQSRSPGYERSFYTLADVNGFYSIPEVPVGVFGVSATKYEGNLQFYAAATSRIDFDKQIVTNNLTLGLRTATLEDASDYSYDIQQNGSIQNGSRQIYAGDFNTNRGALLLDLISGGNTNRFTGQNFGTSEQGGREIVLAEDGLAGLNVTRKIYVPQDAYFARYLDILTNPTTEPITVEVQLTSHFRFITKLQDGFSYNREPRIISTSSGDGALEISESGRDRWVTIDDDEDGDPFQINTLPSVAEVIDGPGAPLQAASAEYTIDFANRFGRLMQHWTNVVVQPGSNVVFLRFLSQQTSRAGAQASAERLLQLPPEALAGLSADELNEIQNFVIPSNGTNSLAPLPVLTGSINGHVLAGDNIAVIGNGQVRFRSNNPLFGRTHTFAVNSAGAFNFAGNLNLFGHALAVPVDAFTLTGVHPITRLLSGPAIGSFGSGLVVATRDVVFADTGNLIGTVRRQTGVVAGFGTVRINASALLNLVDINVPIAADGTYGFNGLPADVYALIATLSVPQGSPIKGVASASITAGQTSTGDITIQPVGVVTGVVRRPNGDVVVNLLVVLRGPGGLTRTTLTDTGGRFTFFDVPVEAVTLETFDRLSNTAASAHVTTLVNQAVTQDLILSVGGIVTGVVTAPGGQPVTDARVTLTGNGGSATNVTGSDGRYQFDQVAPGNFILDAFDPATALRGHKDGSLGLSGETITINLQLFSSATITGRVFRAGGTTPVAGAKVTLSGSDFKSTTSDAQGAYHFDLVPLGNFTLDVTDPPTGDRGRISNQANINGETRILNIPLNGQGTVTVTVRDASSNLVANAQVTLTSQTVFGGSQSALSSPEGTAFFSSVLAGNFSVTANHPLTLLTGSTNGIVGAGAAAAVTVQLRPAGMIVGRVLSPGGTNAVSGATVRLFGPFSLVAQVTSGSDGSFRFDAVPLGDYRLDGQDGLNRLRARETGLRIAGNGDLITRNLIFTGLGTVSGRVLNPDSTGAANLTVTVRNANPIMGGFFSATTDDTGAYQVNNVPVGDFTATARDLPRQLQGETFGRIDQDGQNVTAEIQLLNDAIALPVNRHDGNNFLFDLQGNGSILNGSSSVFAGDFGANRGGLLLDVIVGNNTNRFTAGNLGTFEQNGREIAVREPDLGGLDVTRKVFIPADGYFARYLEILRNPGATAVSATVRVHSNLRGITGAPQVVMTSSGDSILDVSNPGTADRWLVIDDNTDGDPFLVGTVPAVAFGLEGSNAVERVAAASFTSAAPQQLDWQWNVVIPPGGSAAYLHFAAQQTSRQAAQASAARLIQLPPEALVGLNQEEIGLIRNFVVPSDGVSTLASLAALNGSVSGRVLASDTTTLIPSASVRFKSTNVFYGRTYSASSGSSGTFGINSVIQDSGGSIVVPREGYTVWALHPATGVQSPNFAGSFSFGQTNSTQDVVFSNTAILQGNVRRHTGVIVNTGGSIQIVGGTPAINASQTFGTDGAYRISGVPSGNFILDVTAVHPQGSRITGTRTVSIVSGQTTNIDVVLQPTGAVQGTVRDGAGNLASNITVSLFVSGFSRSTATDVSGHYLLSDVPVGNYTVLATEPNSGVVSNALVTIVQDLTATRDFTLIGLGSVKLQVNFAGGGPAAGSQINIQQSARGAGFRFVGYTDSNGRLLIGNVLVGAFNVQAFHPATTALSTNVSGAVTSHGETNSVTATLPALATVQVTVQKQTGAPLENASVRIRDSHSSTFRTAGQTDAQGLLSIANVPQGDFALQATDFISGTIGQTNGTINPANDGQIVGAVVTIRLEPIIVADASVITAESIVPANGGIDPGETVTVNFGLRNTGTARTENLVATLQASGGVSAPSGPQSYGVLTNGGLAVTRAFTFTATAVTGSVLVATFHLQDGALDLGTVTFRFSQGSVPEFMIVSLGSTGSRAVEVASVTGDDRGGIAASATRILLTGDNASGRFVLSDLSGGVNMGLRYEALTANLRTETIYSLGNGTTVLGFGGGTVTSLLEIDGTTGVLTGNRIVLSTPITVGNNSGIFAGYDRVVLHNGTRVYSIALPSGVVSDLGAMANPPHSGSESWAYWGVAEYFAGAVHLVYVQNSTKIVRTRVPDGLTTTVATFANLSDMASFTVSIPNNRWYFHHEGTSQFRSGDETLGYADATFQVDPRLPDDISVAISDAPDPVTVGSNLTYTVTVANSGPSLATGVILSNTLPASVNFVSASTSQGVCSNVGGIIVCDLGTVVYETNAVVTIVVTPALAGTNFSLIANVTRNEVDAYPLNNTAISFTTVNVPAVSIEDVTVLEGNVGTTNAVFIVRLSSPSARTVTVNFVTANATAVISTDYLAATGILNFSPGVTTQLVSVVVKGEVSIEANETFLVNLFNPTNATLADSQAVGTIVNDDGFAGQVDHFAWSAISSPQFVNLPFGVSITAQDAFNATVSDFMGTATLSGSQGAAVTNRILGNIVHQNSGGGTYTLGYSFTPNTNIVVTHVRHYQGTRVSIWTDNGVLLASQNVSSVPGTWIETPLDTPLQLSAGTRYRVGFYLGGGFYYWRNDGSSTFPDGTIHQAYYFSGDGFPTQPDGARWWLVDLRYTTGGPAPVNVSPVVSGNFVNGNWTGNLSVLELATNLVLRAGDGNGHIGTANPLSIVYENDLGVSIADAPDPVSARAPLTYTITVTNTGPGSAAGVTVTNLLPDSVTMVSVSPSQGSYTAVGSNIVCDLGTLAGGTNATITIVVTPAISGLTLSNVVTIGRAESDPYQPNNTAMALTTVSVPTISIDDVSVVERNVGTNPAVFIVRLSSPSARTVTVDFGTGNGTAAVPVDYQLRTGTLSFAAGVTTQMVSVVINGDITIEADETFLVGLFNLTNATLADGLATGTIINDDGFAGQVDHFVWSAISSPQFVNQPFAVSITAQDAANSTVTDFAGTVALSGLATGGSTTNRILGDISSTSFGNGNYTLGYAFTPNTNIVVTHVRHYSGTKVSIWTDSGVLLASQAVSSVPGTWTETPLATPLTLSAGTRYRVTFYAGPGAYYYNGSAAGTFPNGTINQGYSGFGDAFPTDPDSTRYFVGLRYMIEAVVPVNISPVVSGNFVNGNWTGNLTVLELATNLVLRADDNDGHRGTANPLSIVYENDLGVTVADSPDPVSAGAPLTYTITVTNTGPGAATGVSVTNLLPESVVLVSVSPSQGSYTAVGSNIVFDLGTLAGGTNATITIVVTPAISGLTLSNVVTIGRAESDPYLPNNTAMALTTVSVPTISIDDVSVVERNVGTNPAVFIVRLSSPSARTVTVNFGTANVTASTPVDYLSASGTLSFSPGVTTQQVNVVINGDVTIESDEPFVVNLSSPSNATLADNQAVGTIVNDDGFAGQVDHFVWSPISSPQVVNRPFAVTITAQDAANNPVAGFTGAVALSGEQGGTAGTNRLRGDLVPQYNGSGNFTLGYSFTPNTNIIVTHVRHYSGTKVSIWTDSGVLLASQNVSSVPGTWIETPLATPLELFAGTRYRVAAYSGGGAYYYSYSSPTTFPHGTLDQGYETFGDGFPSGGDGILWFVDLRYTLGLTTSIAIDPAVSGNFVGGTWSGNLTVLEPATNVVLRADDGDGHQGVANPLAVQLENDLGVTIADSPDPAQAGAALTYTVTVTNTGPSLATGVVVSNVLPATVNFVSAISSQGTCNSAGGIVTCDLGTLGASSLATVTIVVTPAIGGLTLTNEVSIVRAEIDSYPSNNAARAITTVAPPSITIDDAALVEGNVGTTTLDFTVRLSAPSAQTVTVDFSTDDSSARTPGDYQLNAGTLTFLPGVSTQMVSVVINRDITIETDETFVVNLFSVSKATLLDSQAVGTIVNDDGFAGQVDHFVWSTIASPQLGGEPITVTITAQDAANNIIAGFTGNVALSGLQGVGAPKQILGDLTEFGSDTGTWTVGYSFIPNRDIVVTHVRHYAGTKVSIWSETGTLLASQNVISVPGTWTETPLAAPLVLSAGTTYRVGVYSGNGAYYYRSPLVQTFPDGSLDRSYASFGDTYPSGTDNRQYFVNLRYMIAQPVAIVPTVSGNFFNGAWTGNVTVLEPAANLLLRADDGDGHSGLANLIGVKFENDISVDVSVSPDPGLVADPITYVITVTNTGPDMATEVRLNNFFPEGATLVSVVPSQGSYSTAGNLVTCDLGDLDGDTSATVTIEVTFASAGMVTNVAEVSRAETDAYPANDAVSTIVEIRPRLGGEFRIASLGTSGAQIIDHASLTGDDRGGIALSSAQAFYTGDSSSARFNLLDLSGGTSLGFRYEGFTSDLHTEQVYSLGDEDGPIPSGGGSITRLLEVDGTSGNLTGSEILLSAPIPWDSEGPAAGIFAGYDQIVIHNGVRVYSIALPSGTVTDLGPMSEPSHQSCESWAYWGVAEYFGGSVYLVYMVNDSIVRTRVPDGAVSTVQAFSDLSDMCSITVSVARNRWYFKYEGNAQFGGGSETLGFADASFEVNGGAPTLMIHLSRSSPSLEAVRSGNVCKISFPTLAGRTYFLESAASLTSSSWQTLEIVRGDGKTKTIQDGRPTTSQRFYRLRMN